MTVTTIHGAGAQCAVHAHGAQVTSWIPACGGERLFLSERSSFAPGATIRGGVPVIFPQFSTFGPLPKHGFARTATWALADQRDDRVTFRLTDTPETRAFWPHAFVAELTATVAGAALEIALAVTNTGSDAFGFTAALHTYLRVEDVGAVRILGLDGLRYSDTADGGRERQETSRELEIAGMIDRIYFDATRPIEMHDGPRCVRATMTGFRDVVVWNPGASGGAALSDLEPDGYRRMVCVEAARIGDPVQLAPRDEWTGVQRLVATRAARDGTAIPAVARSQ
jgi:glucose-6-phosphate 1-epimerase